MIAIWVSSAFVAVLLTLWLGYTDAAFVFLAGCLTVPIGWFAIFVCGIINPPKLKRLEGGSFERLPSLDLKNRSDSHGKK